MKLGADDQLSFDLASAPEPNSIVLSKPLLVPDGDVVFYPYFLDEEESNKLFHTLLTQTKWRQDKGRFYGKEINLPRLTAWYGDAGKAYTYSGISMTPEPWTPLLLYIKGKVDHAAGVAFNSVLLNLYRSGHDSLSWHRDNEPELGEHPTICSVSLGETRRFQLKHRLRKELARIDVDLTHGSLLMMKGTTQQFWLHQIPKTSKPVSARINLTFRVIK